MSRTYKATGINLKSMPMGEADRLLTILTREYGLVRAVAMGARKHNSKLGGRSGLFVVNDLLLAKGRSLDKVTQAETLESYPGLGRDLKKLTAGQYLAELCLFQALSDQPQEELFVLLNRQLAEIERSPAAHVLPHLSHAIYQLLVLAGVAPQLHRCCVTRQPIVPDPALGNWRTGFSIPAGGTVTLATLEQLQADQSTSPAQRRSGLNLCLTAVELQGLQHLAADDLFSVAELTPQFQPDSSKLEGQWLAIERILRHYAQYHFDRAIRSASLIDTCFPLTHP